MENGKNIQYTLASIGDLLEQINRCNERINLPDGYKAPELEQSILNAKSLRKQFFGAVGGVAGGKLRRLAAGQASRNCERIFVI